MTGLILHPLSKLDRIGIACFFLGGKTIHQQFYTGGIYCILLEEKIEQTIQVAVVLHYLHADRKQPH
jgi:hypothetical protein